MKYYQLQPSDDEFKELSAGIDDVMELRWVDRWT